MGSAKSALLGSLWLSLATRREEGGRREEEGEEEEGGRAEKGGMRGEEGQVGGGREEGEGREVGRGLVLACGGWWCPVLCCICNFQRAAEEQVFPLLFVWLAHGCTGGEKEGLNTPAGCKLGCRTLETARRDAGGEGICICTALAQTLTLSQKSTSWICAGHKPDGNELLCGCFTHPDLIDFFSTDKSPLMSSFSSY